MRLTAENRAAAVALSGPLGGLVLPGAVKTLRDLAKKYERLQIEQCNGDEPDAGSAEWQARLAAQDDKLEARILAHVAAAFPAGYRVTFGGDPRGFTVKVHTPDGRYNSFGGAEDGYGIA